MNEEITDLMVFSDAEDKNLQAGLEHFKEEVSFFVRLEALFSTPGKKVTDEYTVIIELFQLCHHNLIFSFLNLLRGHFKEPCIISRNSIEAVAQATIIKENPDSYSEIWCKGENDNENKEDVEAFRRMFKKDKFRNCQYKKELAEFYRMFSTFSHPNILTGIHRMKREGDKLLFGFFDTEVDNLDAWMIRYLNYTLLAYSTILKEFSDIFSQFNIIPIDSLEELRKEHRAYMESRRSFLSQDGKYD